TAVYEIITNRILQQLEAGVVPWQRPWNAAAGQPRNLLSQKAYRGINVWMLASVGYACPYWLTYKQAQEIGGQVRRGEHGSPVVFRKCLARPDDSQDSQESDSNARRIPVARLYTVFNAQQCDLPDRLQPFLQVSPAAGDASRQIAACEQILAGMPQRPV